MIPAERRRALGFEPGEEMVLTVRDGGLLCHTQETLVRRYLAATSSDLQDLDVQGELQRLRREESAGFDQERSAKRTLPSRNERLPDAERDRECLRRFGRPCVHQRRNRGGGSRRGIASAGISAINWAEAWAVGHRLDISERRIRGVEELGLQVIPLTQSVAELAAGIHMDSRGMNLSLADCCCLALGLEHSLPVYTADSAWPDLELDIEIRLIR